MQEKISCYWQKNQEENIQETQNPQENKEIYGVSHVLVPSYAANGNFIALAYLLTGLLGLFPALCV